MVLPTRRGFAAFIVVTVLSVAPAQAQDKLKLAIGQMDAWANQAPTLGMKAGIFQKHGIELENFGTQGAGETIQAIISGSADIGIGVGTPGAMRAFAKVRRSAFWRPAIPALKTSIGSCRTVRRSRTSRV